MGRIEEICLAAQPLDAVVLIRGGGADTDFLLFDQFELCRAIAALHIPVITGIGHLKNETIVDLMAHTPTKTPTKAAEFIIAHNQSFEQSVLSEQQRIVIKSQQILGKHTQAILSQNAFIARKARAIMTSRQEEQSRLKGKLVLQSKKLLHQKKLLLNDVSNKALNRPQQYLSNEQRDLINLAGNIKFFTASLINNEKRGVQHYEAMCRMMSPVNILKKGFALVYQDSKIITDGSKLDKGDQIKVRLLDSEIEAAIQQKTNTDGDSFNI